ncbi:MAG: multidrug effflux MFS transporter [bacterium]|nr:multidrug effflux MFS transporter [bacterium]
MTANHEPGRQRSIAEKELIAMLAAISATTALGIDMALPAFTDIRIGLGLSADSPRVALTVTLYFLGLACAQLLYGPFTDRFGRKPVLYSGFVLYALGALGSALAPTFPVLVASRFLWGVGAAGPRALTLAIGRDLFEGDRLARIMAVVASVFMVVPAFAPLLGQVVLSFGSWRWVMAAPAAVILALAVWLIRLPESLPPNRRRPLTLGRTRDAIAAIFTSKVTTASALAVMFDFGSFAAFLGSIQLVFDDVYDRGDQFAYYFAGMSIFMGAVIFTGSRQVKRVGADRVIMVTLPTAVVMSIGLALWSWQSGGRPSFLIWFALITVINSLRTLANPLIQAQAMQPMGDLAGTAAAVIGTITMGGGAILASFVDRAIAGSVTPLVVSYAGYGVIGLAFALWARRHR